MRIAGHATQTAESVLSSEHAASTSQSTKPDTAADRAGVPNSSVSAPGSISGTVGRLQQALGQVQNAASAAAAKMTHIATLAIQGEAANTAYSHEQQTGQQDQANLRELKLQCQQAIRSSLNPLFKLERIVLRDSLPRTASNKVMRRLLRDELRQTSAKL